MNVKLDERYDLYINGTWVPASDGRVFTTTNPATGEKLAECAEATKEDVDAAVQAAWAAFPAWRDLEPDKRADILLKIADVIDENKELLATIESMDNGKPLRETMTIDVPYSSDHIRYFAGAVVFVYGAGYRRSAAYVRAYDGDGVFVGRLGGSAPCLYAGSSFTAQGVCR